jgi:hypothetical protein
MRAKKGLQSEELNLAPKYLIVPAAKEQLAYQYTSSQFVPALASSVNEFRAGGRTALSRWVGSRRQQRHRTVPGRRQRLDHTVEFCYPTAPRAR